MLISKSIFVDYYTFPKLAWWKYNYPDTYKWIQWIDDEETSEQLIELGQTVEDLVWEYFLKKEGLIAYDAFEWNDAKDELDEEWEDRALIQESYQEKRRQNLLHTLEAIRRKEPLIYQPGFQIDGLYVRGDYLKLNQEGFYDIIEVKAKTHVRKIKTFAWEKFKNTWELEKQFLADISFQKYVINRVFEKENLWKLWGFYFAYLNRQYKKQGDIDVKKIILLDQVDTISTIIIEWEEESKEVSRDDVLLSSGVISERVTQMKAELVLSEDSFNKEYPFSWSKYREYFGKEREFGTIYGKWLTSPKAVWQLHRESVTRLSDLDGEQRDLFNKADGSHGSARLYIERYLESWKIWKDIVQASEIGEAFSDLNLPIIFYDYETVALPVPLFENTHPYQQVVVQYSIHKLYQDGRLEHFWWVLWWLSEDTKVEYIDIPDNKNKVEKEQEKVIYGDYRDVLENFLEDIWDDINISSFVVWYKTFENTRNKEIMKDFPEFADSFDKIIKNTLDLMDITKKWYYYSHDFQGSNSIKYVLPALVKDIEKYEDMEISHGMAAMMELKDLYMNDKLDKENKKQIENLLLYCGQDSYAMYKIYEVFKSYT